jgi:glutaredoxin-related protein
MKPKKVLITQSNYIPWKGYFDALQLVDEVILYDDMQYTKRDWRNRNQIQTPQGLKWLTIPVEVKGKYFQAIKDTKISESKWKEKHWRTLQMNYAKASFIKEYKDIIEELYLACEEEYLSLINYRFLQGINQILGIKTPMRFSSDFTLVTGKTERLVDLCKQVGGTDYYTGPAAKNYMDESLFEQENIKVHYLDYSGYPIYPQLYTPFVHGITILDLIFNMGSNAVNYLKNFK